MRDIRVKWGSFRQKTRDFRVKGNMFREKMCDFPLKRRIFGKKMRGSWVKWGCFAQCGIFEVNICDSSAKNGIFMVKMCVFGVKFSKRKCLLFG